MESASRRVLWLTGVGHALGHCWELIFPAVAVPMAAELGLSFAETVRLSFVSYLLFGLGAPLAGWLTDHLGGRKVLILCLCLGGVSGLSVGFSSGPVGLVITLGGLGLAASFYHPAGLALLSHHFARSTGKALGINGMAGNIGIGLTPLVAGLIGSTLGWRWAYGLLALPGLLFGLAFLLWKFEDAGHRDKTSASPKEEPKIDWLAVGWLAIGMTAGGLAYRLHTLVVPALLQERLPGLEAWVSGLPGFDALSNLNNLGATAITSAAYMMGLAGQWVGGKIADSRSLVLSYLSFHLAAMPMVLLAGFAFGPWLVIVLFVYLFFGFGMQPVENTIVAKMSPGRWRGRAYAAKFILTFGIGSTGTFIVGLIQPWAGLGGSLVLSAGLEVLLVGCGAMLWLRLRKTQHTF